MYYLLLPIIYLFAILPFAVLYGISDFCYLVIYKLIGYRKKIVNKNLRLSYPDKTKEALKIIEKKFYRSFFDQWVETVKLLMLSNNALQKRMTGNWDLLAADKYKDRPIYILLGHQFNWEWGNACCQINTQQLFAGLYLPVSNKAVDKLMLTIRRKKGSLLIPADNMLPHMKQLQNKNYILCFMADQTPANLGIAKWYQFMHQPAPFLITPEKASKRAQAAVIYAGISKRKRGHYQVTLTSICDNAAEMPTGSITQTYVDLLTKELNQQPENWLWTHRRWKRTPPENGTIHP